MAVFPVRWWTRKCTGRCAETGTHTHHLTWWGRLSLRFGFKL